MAGQLPPPEEDKDGDLLKQTDIGVARCVDKDGGLGLPWSFMLWHWGMVAVFLVIWTAVFFITTPLGDVDDSEVAVGVLSSTFGDPTKIPWLTFVQKLFVFWHVWESLGLGVLHGPMHAKMKPPFTDWWYRFTPNTLKYRAPFMPAFVGNTRNWLDVAVEGFLTYIFAIRIIIAPEVTPTMMMPLFACALYEFLFDYGQHMHTYGTQTLHLFACMCFPVSQGQVVGMQLFCTWFYFCSGWCKIGPWFKHLNVANLLGAKYMVKQPWSGPFRTAMMKAPEAKEPDYHLTTAAAVLGTLFAFGETLGPLLCLSNVPAVVLLGIFFIFCMHIFIISSLIVDVFTWNFVDGMAYTVLFGIYSTGLSWSTLPSLHPALAAWLLAHALYSSLGNLLPMTMPYVVAHRHAAGNFCQGVLLIKPEAAGKLAKLNAHAGLPQPLDAMNEMGLRWLGQWLAVHLLMAYFWLWNLPNKMLLPLVQYALEGKNYNSYVLIHSVLFFDALVAHVRFDGLSSLQLVPELGRICGFEPGECRLCWVGAFPSFPASVISGEAKWKIIDAAAGVIKEGTYTVAEMEDPEYTKPSACGKLIKKVADTPTLSTSLLADAK
eukprot:CAMPEP_0178414714 /NCGR_PEP_ID=MMETSP0689_2-20121128/23179_1 /TAXON_ID=160604 /ORGANISM="Amphidinium massartii, Strain CS-259" /LENGTH=600 /DNA_ID=CAMNT_0020036013 /DNA_START=145 /DNA_END=1947 /DNA_ORIENTATION=-